MSEECAYRWRIAGRVQGVGFRWSVLDRARALDVVGWARNMPDGSVEVVARGLPNALDRLDEFLATGPTHAHVEDVDKVHIPHESVAGNAFTIK
ncbi:MAG TPA: acylphosphatase [Gemmatimonadales bacterium]